MDLEKLGWNNCAYPHPPAQFHGRVAQAARDRFIVWTGIGELEATLSGHFRHTAADYPCVGDWVELRAGNIITAILPRHTKFARKQPGKELREQVLATNVDALFLVTGLDHDYNPSRLERYLVLACESGARPIVLLNKSDLRDDLEAVLNKTRRHAPGVPVIAVSAFIGCGLHQLPALLKPAETAALIGSSGAGKSTLLNALLGQSRQLTQEVSEVTQKGRHTTTRRELILLPSGSVLEHRLIMDLPGLRELQLWADSEQLDQAFCEIVDLAQNCRFRDCTHNHEPGCAVRDADLPSERLASYQKLQRELAYLEKQSDRQVAQAFKQKTKSIEKQIRKHVKRDYS